MAYDFTVIYVISRSEKVLSQNPEPDGNPSPSTAQEVPASYSQDNKL